MRLALQTKIIGEEVNIFDSSHMRFLTGGVTLDASKVSADEDGLKILRAGTVLGKDGSSGKYYPIVDMAAATLSTGVVANNNRILWTAKTKGVIGNGIKIQLLDPSANSQALSVSVSADTIVVSLATSGAGAITSTANEVIAAVNAHLVAKELVLAAGVTGSTGAAAVVAAAATALSGGVDWAITPKCMLAEAVDLTDGDYGASAVDQARVLSARLPATVQPEVRAVLVGITFTE